MQENKEGGVYGDSKRFHSGMCYSVPGSHQDYYQRYRQTYQNYPSGAASPITAMGVAKGVVMMCTNQRLYEHSGVVTGTFYPPVATSQECAAPAYSTSGPTSATSRSFLAAYTSSPSTPHYTSCSSPSTSLRHPTDSYQGQSTFGFL